MISMKVTGFKELGEVLEKIPRRFAVECDKKATKAGADVAKEQALRYFDAYFGWGKGRTAFFRQKAKKTFRGMTRKKIKVGKLKTNSDMIQKFGVGISRWGMFLELGVRGHVIKPKKKKVLAKETFIFDPHKKTKQGGEMSSDWQFFSKGKKKEVQHPGFQKRPFLRPALYNHQDEIIEAVRKKLAEMVQENRERFEI